MILNVYQNSCGEDVDTFAHMRLYCSGAPLTTGVATVDTDKIDNAIARYKRFPGVDLIQAHIINADLVGSFSVQAEKKLVFRDRLLTCALVPGPHPTFRWIETDSWVLEDNACIESVAQQFEKLKKNYIEQAESMAAMCESMASRTGVPHKPGDLQ